MGWKQWGIFEFSNETTDYNLGFYFPDTASHWGYPFAGNDKSNRTRLDYNTITSQEVRPGASYSYGQTGKENEWAGMEGRVILIVKRANGAGGDQWEKIGHLYYSCPWSGNNACNLEGFDSTVWNVTMSGFEPHQDALGTVKISVKRR